jgi:redox-sensitive bicupin YhaK (pirin superfamily)
MSLRAVKQIIETKPTIEGAGVKLQRAFGFGKTREFDPFLLLDDSVTITRTITPRDFLGIHTAASKPSPTFWPGRSSMVTAWAIKGK